MGIHDNEVVHVVYGPCKIHMDSLPWMVCFRPWFARRSWRSCCKILSCMLCPCPCLPNIHSSAWGFSCGSSPDVPWENPRGFFFVGCLESLHGHYTVGHHHRGWKLHAHWGLYREFCFWWIVWIYLLETPFLCRPKSQGALSGSGWRTFLFIMWPKYLISFKKKSNFASLPLNPYSCNFSNTFIPVLCWTFTGNQYIIQVGCSVVKVTQHGVHDLQENCRCNHDSKSQSGIFVQSSIGVDKEQFGTFFIHRYLKICVWEVNFGEDFSTI